jgi:hypothetical protein
VRGSKNSLERNYHYSIKKDLIFRKDIKHICEICQSLERYEKTWMNGRVRSMKLQLDQALMSHIGVTGTSPTVREDYTSHGLHLISHTKKRLMQLIAVRVVGGHVSDVSSIPVKTHDRASLSFSLNSKAQRCLTYIKCSPTVLEAHKQTAEGSNSISFTRISDD